MRGSAEIRSTSAVRMSQAGYMDTEGQIPWVEIDRGEAAMVLWATRWSLPLNPEDCEAIAASVIWAARSGLTREEIYAETERAIALHMGQS